MPNKGIKAKNMQVHISGVQGKHPIQTGVAYWYRGHYLFGPQHNPVEPVPFATKEVHVMDTVTDTAPSYNRKDPRLQNERRIGALRKGMIHEWDNMTREGVIEPPAEFSADQSTVVESLTPKYQDTQSAQVPMTRTQGPPSAPTYTQPALDCFYNKRAMYLAASAPTSNHGTPMHSNTPYGPRSLSPLHGYGSGGGLGSGVRQIASMTRVDRLVVDHGIKHSASTWQECGQELLNESVVLAFTSGRSPRPAALSRIPSMYSLANDNLSMGELPVGRPNPRAPTAATGRSNGFGNAPRPLSLHPGKPPVNIETTDNWDGFGNVSRPVSRVASVGSKLYEGFGNSSYLMPRVSSVPANMHDGLGYTSQPMARVSSVPTNMRDDLEDAYRLDRYMHIDPSNNWDGFGSASRPMSRIPSVATGMDDNFGGTPHLAPLMQDNSGNMWENSSPASRPPSRIPSAPSNLNDGYDGFDDVSRPLVRVPSLMSLIGENYNGHQNIFFLNDTTTIEPLRKLTPSCDPIGTGRPRKDSMAKASRALNETFYNNNRPAHTLNPDIGGSDCAITTSSTISDLDGFNFNDKGSVLKCCIHDNDCDGVTVMEVHQTEHARRTKGVMGNPPMIEVGGRLMVDWLKVLQEEQARVW